MATAHAPFRSLPDDLLQRLLVGLPLEDHRTAASICKAFRDVIDGSRFLDLRRRYGFAERGIVTIVSDEANDNSRIRVAHNSGGTARINGRVVLPHTGSTNCGSRLFVSTSQPRKPGAAPSQILAVDVSSRRWRPIAILPRNQRYHCMEVHGGLLYVAGGAVSFTGSPGLHSLHVFNETTGLWDNSLPPMPQASIAAASGVIGNELFIAGGFNFLEGKLKTLQIYDIAGRTWRLGAPLPEYLEVPFGVVLDGKLFVISRGGKVYVYEPQSNSWTKERGCPTYAGLAVYGCAHGGRIVVFLETGVAVEREDSLTWSNYDPVEPLPESGRSLVAGSLLLA